MGRRGVLRRPDGRALAYSPILLFIDPGVEACLANCRSRPWEPHKYASKDEQDEKLEFLLSWVRDYDSREGDLSLTAHQALFEGYRGLKLRLAHVERSLIDDLGARFEACAIPAKEWTHAAHLVVGLWHVHRYGAADALLRLRSGIRRLNESHGGVNSATNGYHETITAVYVQLLSQYLESGSADIPLSMRALWLLGSPLAAKDALFTFYSRDRLMSTDCSSGVGRARPCSIERRACARKQGRGAIGQFPIECGCGRGVRWAHDKNSAYSCSPRRDLSGCSCPGARASDRGYPPDGSHARQRGHLRWLPPERSGQAGARGKEHRAAAGEPAGRSPGPAGLAGKRRADACGDGE